MAKKQKKSKVLSEKSNNSKEHEKQLVVKVLTPEPEKSTPASTESKKQKTLEAGSNVPETTATSTESKKQKAGVVRGVCAMHKVVMKKAKGKKIKVRYDKNGTPIGDGRHALASYVGMSARTLVPIDIPSWPKVDPELKAKLWDDIEVQTNPVFLFPILCL